MFDRRSYYLYLQLYKSESEKQCIRKHICQAKNPEGEWINLLQNEQPNKTQREAVNMQLSRATEHDHIILDCFDERYPDLLRQIDDFPFVLYCRGDITRLADKFTLSIVGTRKPTYDGEKMCDLTTAYLSKWPYTIISGLAFGIDSLAHRGALNYGCPTIAVLASSVDKITPRSHQKLADAILRQGGLIISEYPYGHKIKPYHYVQRNRIVSGLSKMVFIVEGGIKSGSMTTAEHALNQNRELFVMPGSITNQVATGTNYLLKSGAVPIVEPSDFFYETSDIQPDENAHPIVQLLKSDGQVSIDQLSQKFDLPIPVLLGELTLLECDHFISINDQVVYLR